MHGKHEHADNLFLRLSSYSPDSERSRLEDFCSEALVWCLRNSIQFRRQFFDFIQIPFLHNFDEAVIIHSQQRYDDEVDDDVQSFVTGRFDIVIEADDSSFFVAIECKVGAAFGKGQIDKYLKRLETAKRRGKYKQCELVTLTNVRDAPVPNVKHLFWGQVHEALTQTYRDTHPNSSSHDDQEIKSTLKQFSDFLELKKLANMKIQKMDTSKLREFMHSISLRKSLDDILLSLKTTKHLKAMLTKKQPKLDIQSSADVYLAYSDQAKLYLYVGFHIWEDEGSSFRLSMYIERSLDGDRRKLAKQLKGVVETTDIQTGFDEGRTWFSFEQIVEGQFDGDAEAIRDWFNTYTLLALDLGKKIK